MAITKWTRIPEARFNEMRETFRASAITDLGFCAGQADIHRTCTKTGIFRATYPAFVKIDTPDGSLFFEAAQPLTAPEFRALTREDVLAA